MKENITITKRFPNGINDTEKIKPRGLKERINYHRLKNRGVLDIFQSIRDLHVLNQRSSVSTGADHETYIELEQAIIRPSNQFSRLSLSFDGTNGTRYEDGSFISVDLIHRNKNELRLTYGFDNKRVDLGIIPKNELAIKIGGILALRERKNQELNRMLGRNLL